jgi:multicomponent Na+:H+ antiporter subunit D
MTSFADHIPVLIIVIPLISALVALAAGWIDKRTSFFITVTTVSGQFVASLFLLYRVQTRGILRYWLGGWQPPWGIEYVIDGLNAYVLVVVLLMALICVVYSKRNIEHELPQKRITFYTLLQLLITGLCGITVTGDIFNMYVFIEIMSLSAYALTASRGKIALKASFTYLILGSIGACFFLLGIGFLYAITGSLNMQDVAQLLPPFYSNKMVTAAFVFFLVGLSIKMALFPLHTWLPDAHAFAPSEISALLSGIIIEIAAYAFIRVTFSVFTVEFIQGFPVLDILSWVAVAAILYGSWLALSQQNLKRMLAYSSVANMGYIVLGIGLSISSRSSTWGGLTPACMHILNHALMKGCLFLGAGAFIYKANLWNIADLRGMGRKMPWTSAAFTIAALSMIGVPPTVGFASKVYLILASLETKQFVFVVVLLLSSLLNLVYFGRVLETLYMKKSDDSGHAHSSSHQRDEIPTSMLIPIITLGFFCVLFGVLWLIKVPLPLLHNVNTLFQLGGHP